MAEQPPAQGSWEAPADLSVGPAPGVKFGGAGARLVAYIVDELITTGVSLVFLFVVGLLIAAAGSAGADLIAGLGFFLAFCVWFAFALAYFPFFWARSGQTPGMRLVHLKVVRDEDGGPVTVGPAILRLVCYWINQIAFYIGFLWIFVDKRHRGWHDLIAGTCVIEA